MDTEHLQAYARNPYTWVWIIVIILIIVLIWAFASSSKNNTNGKNNSSPMSKPQDNKPPAVTGFDANQANAFMRNQQGANLPRN